MRGLIIISLFFSLVIPEICHGQKRHKTLENLSKFDRRPYHFGVQLSYNSADFFIDRRYDPLLQDSLLLLDNQSRPGFNIAIIAELHLSDNLGIRFIPGISPKERVFNYTLIEDDGQIEEFEKSLRSFYIDFPLNVKYRTDRIKNFAAYVLAGAQYSRDMASQERVNNSNLGGDLTVVKLQRNDILINAGGGFDFFLPYFKFGIELKLAVGTRNMLIQDNTRFSTPIESLRSKNWVLSFTFEG